jgi:membrane-bound lytic murein transglycosylase D
LLAIAKIFANADEYKIHLQHIPNKPYFEVVDIKSPLDLHKAAQLANTPLHKFLKLNPGFNRASTAPQGPHRLLVPVDQVQAFKENLATLPFSERVDLKQYDEQVASNRTQVKPSTQIIKEIIKLPLQYTVKSGDNIASIATKNHTTPNLLTLANHLGKTSIHAGMKLLIPGQEKVTNVAMVAPNKINAKPNKFTNIAIAAPTNINTKPNKVTASTQVYAVKKGDTIHTIAKYFAVAPQELADWNNVTLKTALTLGQKLTIKSVIPQLASAAPSIHLISYKVGEGDTLVKIAKKFNVPLADLQKTNASNLVKGLHPGLKLKVLVDSNQYSS